MPKLHRHDIGLRHVYGLGGECQLLHSAPAASFTEAEDPDIPLIMK